MAGSSTGEGCAGHGFPWVCVYVVSIHQYMLGRPKLILCAYLNDQVRFQSLKCAENSVLSNYTEIFTQLFCPLNVFIIIFK